MVNFAQIKRKSRAMAVKARRVFLAVFVPNEENGFLPNALKSKYLFWYGALLLAIKIGLISLALILPSTKIFSAITADRLIALINQERQARNLSTLALNASLNSVADLKAGDMLAQNYFAHTSPAGLTPWHWFKQIGYNYIFAGENLAMGFSESDAVFQAWMNSPSHRANILSPNYQEMGLAVKSGQIQNHVDTLAVLVFGKQQTLTPKTKVAPPSVKTTKGKPTPSVSPKISILPAPTKLSLNLPASPVIPSVSPSAIPSQIELKTILAIQPEETPAANQIDTAPARIGYAPRVLGEFTSKSDEIFKCLYLYFTLFLAIALLVNIFVKIRFQRWPTIIAATLIILMSTALIFI